MRERRESYRKLRRKQLFCFWSRSSHALVFICWRGNWEDQYVEG